ncbi:MgtC/SapB family protein [Immundisolibacter sp.]
MDSNALPPLLLQFAATVVLSFVLGLELHSYRRAQDEGIGFGTTRTLTLIGAAGFVLWLLDGPQPRGLYLAGLAALAAWLTVDLARGARLGGALAAGCDASGALLPALIVLLTYGLGPLTLTQPAWLVAAVLIVAILMLAEKPLIRRLSDALPVSEGVTLAKFLILAGLVLPLLPDTPIPGLVDISYAKVWMAVVVISGISYLGYLAHTYVFPAAGTLLTGALGGVYSSTAATVVLARQARTDPGIAAQAPAATVLATAMMYVRLWLVIIALGHWPAALRLALPFGLLLAGSLAMTWWLWRRGRSGAAPAATAKLAPHNPLDLPVAFLFAGLFVAFAALTAFVTQQFGVTGLHVLSFLVGFTDIDPFVLSLLAGHFQVSETAVTTAILIASGSNNLLKADYAIALSRQRTMLPAAAWLALTLAVSALWTMWLWQR